ncbi:MAG: LytTR family DNA-binding domain-containing protein, partial [Bacteroidota bacterium]
EQSTYISNRGISNLEEKLHPQTFMRVHRSHIININRVVNFTRQGKGFLALMRSNKTVKVSRGYAAEIKKIIL